MGRIRAETVSDYHKHGFDMQVWCRYCGYKAILTPDFFLSRGLLGRIEELERRLRCTKCGQKSAVISTTTMGPSGGKRRGTTWQDRVKPRE